MEKAKVSQDFLFKIINDNGVNVSALASMTGLSEQMVNGCFRHNKDMNGNPRNFPEKSLPRLNAALVEFAGQLRESLITFGSDRVYTNNRGVKYDPACVERVNGLQRYFKLTKFLNATLGWSQNTKSQILHSPSSKAHGCVSQDDVNCINARILAVAGMLDGIEVVTSI